MTPPNQTAIGRALIDVCVARLCEESVGRLKKCLGELSEEEIWHRPNEQSNSVGNLVLHLCGNVRQWIVSGLGGEPDKRRRDKEFAERGPLAQGELLDRLESTMAEARATIEGLSPERLLDPRRIQGSDENAVSALVHVTEHFSYHVGQVTYVTKALKAIDVGYYAGEDLNQLNEPG